jgi:hypothetical protein
MMTWGREGAGPPDGGESSASRSSRFLALPDERPYTPLPTEQEFSWAPEGVCVLYGTERRLVLSGIEP